MYPSTVKEVGLRVLELSVFVFGTLRVEEVAEGEVAEVKYTKSVENDGGGSGLCKSYEDNSK